MRKPWEVAAASILSVVLVGSLLFLALGRSPNQFLTGHNDFMSFYAGGRLAGSPDLYSAERSREIQEQSTGAYVEALRYIRLPFHAGLLWPLGRMPYKPAYWIWESLLVLAFACFVALWRPPELQRTLLFSCYSVPAFAAVLNGQDVTLLLAAVAVSVHLLRQRRTCAAGVVFAFCAAKFHLFLLSPLLALREGGRKFVLGAMGGGAFLLSASFVVGGWDWPLRFLRALADQRIHPGVGIMPNLHALTVHWPAAKWLEWPLAAVVCLSCWRIVRRAPFQYALSGVLAGGLLISYHAYLADCVFLLPAALTVHAGTEVRWLRMIALFLLTPVPYFLLLFSNPASLLVPAATLALVFGMAWEATRRTVWRDV